MKFYSATLCGIQPIAVEIELDLSPGLPFFQIVGLPDEVLKESKTRVKSAIMQAGYDFPYEQRLVLNLSPSRLKKEGSGFELALAARILHGSGQVAVPDDDVLFLGELALDGSVRSVEDMEALAFVTQLTSHVKLLVVPEEVANLLASKLSVRVCGVRHLEDFKVEKWWEKKANVVKIPYKRKKFDKEDFDKFLFTTEWAWHLSLAVVGKLHYFLCGPPGCGKTFFAESARWLTQYFRDPSAIDSQSASLLSVLDCIFKREKGELPWAAPHHSISTIGLVGGSSPPKPGAVTRAHGGILFLDELLEFSPASLDALREPLEKGEVEIARSGHHTVFPCDFQLIAAANPCRCGYWKSTLKGCTCSGGSRGRYQLRLSGPLLDRFDVKLFCRAPLGSEDKVSGLTLKNRIREALKLKSQSRMAWHPEAEQFLDYELGNKIKNHRVLKKVQKIAPLIATLEFSTSVELSHVNQALNLQNFSFE